MLCRKSIIVITILAYVFGSNIKRPAPTKILDPFRFELRGRIGDNPFPTNPMADRARGYLLQGKAQTAILNYGNYIDIEVNPNGAWCDVGDYICYAKYSGQKFMYKGMKLLLIFDDQVIMKVETPSLLDPTYHLTN